MFEDLFVALASAAGAPDGDAIASPDGSAEMIYAPDDGANASYVPDVDPYNADVPAPVVAPYEPVDTVIGMPSADAAHWHEQQGANSCAVVAQASILEEVRGIPFDEQAACAQAQAGGWYDPQTGTPPWAVGELLEANGLPCSSEYGADFTDLADALVRGDKVVVGLNANEIWTPAYDPATGAPLQQDPGGHAVWVTGLQAAPDGSVHVLLNDSGTDGGRMEPVEVHDFLNAWADYDNFTVIADA